MNIKQSLPSRNSRLEMLLKELQGEHSGGPELLEGSRGVRVSCVRKGNLPGEGGPAMQTENAQAQEENMSGARCFRKTDGSQIIIKEGL